MYSMYVWAQKHIVVKKSFELHNKLHVVYAFNMAKLSSATLVSDIGQGHNLYIPSTFTPSSPIDFHSQLLLLQIANSIEQIFVLITKGSYRLSLDSHFIHMHASQTPNYAFQLLDLRSPT